jgi:hypothetical protein
MRVVHNKKANNLKTVKKCIFQYFPLIAFQNLISIRLYYWADTILPLKKNNALRSAYVCER